MKSRNQITTSSSSSSSSSSLSQGFLPEGVGEDEEDETRPTSWSLDRKRRRSSGIQWGLGGKEQDGIGGGVEEGMGGRESWRRKGVSKREEEEIKQAWIVVFSVIGLSIVAGGLFVFLWAGGYVHGKVPRLPEQTLEMGIDGEFGEGDSEGGIGERGGENGDEDARR